jgi:hypothetical protein
MVVNGIFNVTARNGLGWPVTGFLCFCGCWYGKGMESAWCGCFVCFLAYAARLDVFVLLF